jgi:hypothetical protein
MCLHEPCCCTCVGSVASSECRVQQDLAHQAHSLLVGIIDNKFNNLQGSDLAHHVLHHTTVARGYGELSLPVCRSLCSTQISRMSHCAATQGIGALTALTHLNVAYNPVSVVSACLLSWGWTLLQGGMLACTIMLYKCHCIYSGARPRTSFQLMLPVRWQLIACT